MWTSRSTVPAIIALALIALPLAPSRHVHRAGIEGRTVPLVHAHQPDGSSAGSRPIGTAWLAHHGDHNRALFLNADFTAPGGAAASAVSPGDVGSVEPPEIERRAIVPGNDASTIHGPPRLASITRGPPSLS